MKTKTKTAKIYVDNIQTYILAGNYCMCVLFL